MTNKILGFDLDGVIIDHAALKMRLARQFGFELALKQTPSEIIEKKLPMPILRKIQHHLYDDSIISLLSPIMPGFKKIIKDATKKEVPFFLISRRRNADVAIRLLKFHKLWPKYFNKHNTFFVLNPEDKNAKAVEIGISHYIDDEFKVLESLADVKNKYLFDQFDVFKNIDKYERIKSWQEFTI